MRIWFVTSAIVLMGSPLFLAQAPSPTDWIDQATGHRVVRITGDAGGSTLYFGISQPLFATVRPPGSNAADQASWNSR